MDFGVQEGPGTSSLRMLRDGRYFGCVCRERNQTSLWLPGEKAECQRIDVSELWCWRRLLRVPWTTRRSNQSILEEISPEYSLEGLMLKLKLQYFGHLMQS